MLAAERLIVPCTAAGFSARVISNIDQLVYGHRVPPDYEKASFSYKATEEFSMTLPKMRLVAIVASYQGKPIRKLRAGKIYDLDGEPTTVNHESLDLYRRAIQKLVGLL